MHYERLTCSHCKKTVFNYFDDDFYVCMNCSRLISKPKEQQTPERLQNIDFNGPDTKRSEEEMATKICKEDGCNKSVAIKKLCPKHAKLSGYSEELSEMYEKRRQRKDKPVLAKEVKCQSSASLKQEHLITEITAKRNAHILVPAPQNGVKYDSGNSQFTDMRTALIRTFETGATRSPSAGKPEYAGYLSPFVIMEFGKYMLKHQTQSDGNMRDSRNWQKGIPLESYMQSMFRHFIDVWLLHENRQSGEDQFEEVMGALMALLFNVQGMAHEILMAKA